MGRILDFINLAKGEDDKTTVLENVKSNISFRGANLWILACAIVVASIGLNVNSTAVIIGAMLISPLMGPIIGAGFSLGIYDFGLLKKSLKNLLIATVVSLVVSTIYFYLSPFKETQSELLARTSPNIYDILIAFFGGLVGVIAITRKEKGNPIPGVAIATALMPPLCTAGYGLAIGNFRFFAGAIFLYTINCVFICVATFLIVKFLKYPRIIRFEKAREKQITYAITFLTVILLLPSVYFAYALFEQKKFDQKIATYLDREFTQKGYTIIYKNTDFKGNANKIELALLSKKFTPEEKNELDSRLSIYGLEKTKLVIRQDTTNLKQDILNQIKNEKADINQKDVMISELKKEIADNTYDNKSLLEEAKVLFPSVTDISISNHPFHVQREKVEIYPVAIYSSVKELPKSDVEKLAEWIRIRIKKVKVQIFWKRES
ncbi:MAG: TIGR00341 family protein [Flavobacterium sp.]|uniref:TIGR00341 family protein n=1 Tax=Flavobacterium sp. TaxID=239 RepID=UPI00120F7D4C|nr:TIGR00341 family protein [Flavobacterium sp.]RZJ65448.1 MAG: TIGR00341 family protein [Flavobacterium sp.]